MNPLAIGGALVLGYLAVSAAGSASSASGTQQQMIYRDYSWLIMLPSTQTNAIAPGGLNPTVIQELPPPPGSQPTDGNWHEYPGGYQAVYAASVAKPGTPQNPLLPVFPGVAPGMSIYMWWPSQKYVLRRFNGYWTIAVHWGPTKGPDAAWWAEQGKGVFQHVPHLSTQGTIPGPPPMESAKSGRWVMVHPGYLVWLTLGNVNSGELASFSFALPAPGTTPATVSPPINPPVSPAGTPGAPALPDGTPLTFMGTSDGTSSGTPVYQDPSGNQYTQNAAGTWTPYAGSGTATTSGVHGPGHFGATFGPAHFGAPQPMHYYAGNPAYGFQ